mmetsp:Transcript_12022/g.39877  ORF Transcript_12022/g.39877 Transcript_12022/m.39877 type:complete len:352 (+) Transcript_12022:507-1562(+)
MALPLAPRQPARAPAGQECTVEIDGAETLKTVSGSLRRRSFERRAENSQPPPAASSWSPLRERLARRGGGLRLWRERESVKDDDQRRDGDESAGGRQQQIDVLAARLSEQRRDEAAGGGDGGDSEGADEGGEEHIRAKPRPDEQPLPRRVEGRQEEDRPQVVELGVDQRLDARCAVEGHRRGGIAALWEEARHHVGDGVPVRVAVPRVLRQQRVEAGASHEVGGGTEHGVGRAQQPHDPLPRVARSLHPQPRHVHDVGQVHHVARAGSGVRDVLADCSERVAREARRDVDVVLEHEDIALPLPLHPPLRLLQHRDVARVAAADSVSVVALKAANLDQVSQPDLAQQRQYAV